MLFSVYQFSPCSITVGRQKAAKFLGLGFSDDRYLPCVRTGVCDKQLVKFHLQTSSLPLQAVLSTLGVEATMAAP